MYFRPDERLVKLLRESQNIVLVTHIYPDGDGLGSEVALADVLLSMGKNVKVWNTHGPPEQLSFVDARGYVEIIAGDQVPHLPEMDLIVSVDTAELNRLGYLQPYFMNATATKVACDHHILPASHPFTVAWAEEQAGATGLLVLDLIDTFGVKPSRLAATALFVAIASDTGWFSFSNTGFRELDAAARLVALGASPSEIHRRVTGNTSLARTTLLGEVLASVKSEFDGRFVWSCILLEQMTEKGLRYEELDGIVDELKRVQDVGIVALIIGLANNRWKVSLRGPNHFDVDTIARNFGGGGHAKAAGYRVKADSLNTILGELRQQVDDVLAGDTPKTPSSAAVRSDY